MSVEALHKSKRQWTTIKPLSDRVVLRRIEQENGRIQLTDKEPSTLCEVVAIGPGKWKEEDGRRWFEPTSVKKGARVIIGPYIDLEGDGIGLERGLVMCTEADIRCVVEEPQISRCA